jgi:hypothetical protein
MNYEEFKEFHDKHPDLDNTEYYAEFPETNKSTLRSWKMRAVKVIDELTPDSKQQTQEDDKYKVMYAQSLAEQIGYNEALLKGVPVEQQLIVLQNAKALWDESNKKKRAGNSSILPQPLPQNQTTKSYGIDEFMEFDTVKNEIRMMIPMDYVLDPEKNRKLGLLK